MDQLTSILAALDAGKLPSQPQLARAADWLTTAALPDGAGDLSARGRLLADDVRAIVAAYSQLAARKNGDNTVQQIVWHLRSADRAAAGVGVDADEAAADLAAVRTALATLVQTLWASTTSEAASVLGDFASVARLALADAAAAVEGSAARAKDGLRAVEDGVQGGARDALGRAKKSDEEREEEQDVRVRFEKGMDAAKGAGASVIGAGQAASATASELSSRAGTRAQDAYLKICERAQSDKEYHDALATTFALAQKWLTRSLDAATGPGSTSLASFVHDPSPEQHVPTALRLLGTVLGRLAGGQDNVDGLLGAARACVADVRQDKDLQAWFEGFFGHLRRSLDEPGYASGADAKAARKDLRARWRALQDPKTGAGAKWTRDVEALKARLAAVQEAVAGDKDLAAVRAAHAKLGADVEAGLKAAGSEAETGVQAAMEQALWFWQDLFKVYVPRALSLLKDIPIPRIEYKDDETEFVLENLDISSFNLLPSHVYIRNITDVDISASAGATTTAVGGLTHIRVQALQLALKDVSFWYKDKTATLGPAEHSGLLALQLPEKGIDVDVKVRLLPAGPARAARQAFHAVELADVRISDAVALDVRDSNHAVLLALFRPVLALRLRDALARTLAAQLRAALAGADALAWDVARRAEVFADAGLGRGAALAAAAWSAAGAWRRAGAGAWRATGTGVVREGGASFALGAEPQILAGEKRGPLGRFSESVRETVEGVVGQAQEAVGAGAEAAGMDVDGEGGAAAAREGVKGLVQEGTEAVGTFRARVAEKADAERGREGWESAAFDVV